MSNYLDTRDLSKRKEELEGFRDAVTDAETELNEAQEAYAEHEKGVPVLEDGDTEAFNEASEQWDEEAEPLTEAISDAESNLESAKADFGDDEKAELAELETLENEISRWRHGETLIPEDSFTDYCREMLEDCGDIPANLPAYIENNINWDGVADDLKADYSEVEYQGTTYLFRS